MKTEKISIKWKIFTYMLFFTLVLLLIVWFFQTVYLDKFYKRIKKSELNNAKDNIISVIDEENIDDAVETIASRYDICVIVTDTSGNKIASSDNYYNCSIHKMSENSLVKLYKEALKKGGEIEIKNISVDEYEAFSNFNNKPSNKPSEKPDYIENDETFMMPEIVKDVEANEGSEGSEESDSEGNSETVNEAENETEKNESESKKEPKGEKDNPAMKKYEKLPNMPKENDTESIVKVVVVKNSAGEEYVVFLNSIITPVGATVHTLRIQLIYISGIMIILSLIIAFMISKRVSRSIIKVNESAKELSKGRFDVEFDGKDYKEITELSNTLNYTAKQLEKTDVLQKELLANVSHDLRTPLTMIEAYSEVMRDIPGENTPENVQVIIDESKRLTYLVNDLLDLSKIQAGVTNLEMKVYDLTESIKVAIDRYSKMIEPYGYVLDFEFEKHILVEADEFKIYQVIYNLIGNAVNYTGEDKKVNIKQIIKGSKVRIEVIDTGEGIPKDKLESVWDRYYKIDKSHKRAIMGSGLGLSIVQNILKLHEAKYGVDSVEGEGSTFWFELSITE